jgi:long-chain acyl-CoA synthetase
MILDYLELHAHRQANTTFLGETEESYSFGAFFELVTHLAAWLRNEGVRKGDRVVLYLSRHIYHLAAYLATMTLGAIPVHLYSQRKPSFVAFAASHTSARLIITDSDSLDEMGLPCAVVNYPDNSVLDLDPVWPGERHEVAYMMFTSGTTGTPKAVITTQENVDFVTRTLIGIANITVNDREIIVMPLGSTGGLGHFHANLILGNPTIILPYFFGAMDDADLHHMLDVIEAEGITGFLSTPGMLARLTDTHREAFREKGRNLRYILANVTPIRDMLVRDLISLLPHTRFYTYYGLTEASRSVYHCFNDNPDKIATAGLPSSGVQISIDNPSAKGVGEVLIKGSNVMVGYWEMGDHGFSASGWFRTGDLGSLDTDGYLTICGRIKENIKVDGLECLPQDVETVLLAHPEVADCAVVGLPDPKTYQCVAAAIVPAIGINREGLAQRLQTHCIGSLEFYKAPTVYAFFESIPRTDLGKIKRDDVIRQLEATPDRQLGGVLG